MSRPKAIKVDRRLIAVFNDLRQENHGKPLSYTELCRLYSQIGISLNHPLLNSLIHQGCMIRVDRFTYSFVESPIHINLLHKAVNNYYQLKEHYRISGEAGRKQLAIENAIHLLKENGYIILDKKYVL